MQDNSIWSTIEMICIAQSFSYEDYCDLHKLGRCKGARLRQRAYEKLNEVFNLDFEDYMNEGVKID